MGRMGCPTYLPLSGESIPGSAAQFVGDSDVGECPARSVLEHVDAGLVFRGVRSHRVRLRAEEGLERQKDER